ncbi:MAG: DegT/DnrJ/EryC1/StrS family aminotransferase [Chloroflexi bacterium]|nr:DegT/DnrJ/EryC1/StrS family aminotransferase [Chloroflexota bacterium]
MPIGRPVLGDEELMAVKAVLESGELIQGRWVAEFEARFADMCGVRHAVATSSGTSALHLALLAHGIGPGDEVITTAFTFMASTSTILYVGARPIFADIDPETFTLDPDRVEALITPRTRAIMPVDLYGHPADLVAFEDICQRRGLVLIEDACQAHGAAIGDRKAGSFGTACFSFYPSKNMTTAEGGMITTDDVGIADAARRLRHHGQSQTYVHDELGFNFRMTNIQAAIGIEQLKRLSGFNAQRMANARFLDRELAGLPTPVVRPGARHAFHQYTLRVPGRRAELASALRERGIETRVYYPLPVHQQKSYLRLGYPPVQLPETERAAAEVLSLPVHPSVSPDQLAYIARTVREIWNELALPTAD